MVVITMLAAAATAQAQLTGDSIKANGAQAESTNSAGIVKNLDYVPVAPFEGELWLLGLTAPISNSRNDMFGWDAGVELRYNEANSHLSYGGMAGIYLVNKWKDDDPGIFKTTGGGVLAGPVIEYDWGRGRGCSTYTSASAGVCYNDNTGLRPYLRPKVGVEFLNFIRLSLSGFYSGRGSLSWAMNIGLVVGGWPKK